MRAVAMDGVRAVQYISFIYFLGLELSSTYRCNAANCSRASLAGHACTKGSMKCALLEYVDSYSDARVL